MASIVAAAVVRADDLSKQVIAIDLTTAIKIGDFTVSRYLFDKAYQQFVTPIARRTGQKPTTEELDHWFRLYLAQQLVKADLVAQKQLDRPEVVEITERMSRYILTETHGPLYREFGGTDPNAFRRKRRVEILKECRFFPLPANIGLLWTALAPPFSRGKPPRDTDVAPIGSAVLASYVFDGATKQISALDFVRDFQQGIARMVPHDVDDLRQQIEDIAVAEYDLAEAKRRHLDQTPQFLEDRRNFALNQVLAFHEKEVLSKQAGVSPEESEEYYRANPNRYLSPVEITGILYLFSDSEQAQRSLTSIPMANDSLSALRSEEVVDPFVLRRGNPSLLPKPYAFFVFMPIGQRYGPFPYLKKYAIFLKRGMGEMTPSPFEDVRQEIQMQLGREKMTARELDYLGRNTARVKIYIDPAKYGIKKINLNPVE